VAAAALVARELDVMHHRRPRADQIEVNGVTFFFSLRVLKPANFGL
jgi:hypothetical protein